MSVVLSSFKRSASCSETHVLELFYILRATITGTITCNDGQDDRFYSARPSGNLRQPQLTKIKNGEGIGEK